MKKLIALSLAFCLFHDNYLSATISEEQIRKYSSAFMTKLMEENPGQEDQIREFLNGFIKDGSAGIRLVDKIAIFLHNSKNKGIDLGRTRFFYTKNTYCIFIVMEDPGDSQQYTLYLEYRFDRQNNRCTLENIYFSLVFSEKMKNLTEFFSSR